MVNLQEKWVKFKSFVIECRRVLRVTRKPTKEEYKTVVKASALGMAAIGALGFLIHLLRQLLFPPIA